MSTHAPTLLSVTNDDGIREITFCRPELLNRFDAELHHDLTDALLATATDSGVRAVVLASQGKVFSAGGDFGLMRQAHDDPSSRKAIVEDARRLLSAFLDLPQPVAAAVQGAAVGLGATIALACDALVMYRGASLADTHVNVGLVAGDGGCLVWPQAVGMLRARRHLLSGDPLDAETAFALGAVTDLVDTQDEVLPTAQAVAGRFAAAAPFAVRGTKQVLNTVSRARAAELLDLSLASERDSFATDDLLEGIAAFRERRPARFTGQ